MYDEKKTQIRRKVKPGNSKTLWDAFKIASDKEVIQIPNTMKLNNVTIHKDEIPETFANYFHEKIETLTSTCTIDPMIHNGSKILESTNENFMTEYNIMQIITTQKNKKL